MERRKTVINKEIHQFPIIYSSTPGRYAIGWGAHTTVADECTRANIKKALITTTGLKGTGIVDEIKGILEYNGVATEVYDKVFDQGKFGKMKLLGKALESLKLYGDSKEISYMVLNRDDFKTSNSIESDTDTFVNFSLAFENVKIGILFIELKQGFKVSFRSKGNIPVNELAAEFGGGGHKNASGLRITDGKMEDFISKILSKAEQYLERN